MKTKRKTNWKHLAFIPLCMALPLVSVSVSCSSNDSDERDTSIYRLQFNDANNIGKNTAGNDYGNAKVVGQNFVVKDQHKDSHELVFGGGSKGSNYLEIPKAAINHSKTTIAMWLKLPQNTANSNQTLFSIDLGNNHYISVSAFDTNTWNSFAIHVNFNGTDTNLTAVDPDERVHDSEAPLTGTLQPVFDSWQLIAFTFTKNNMKVYQNGKKVLSYQGDYSLLDKAQSLLIGSGNGISVAGNDFAGSLSDIRIFDKDLDQQDYQDEFSTSFYDYQTIDMDFANGDLHDTIRNYDGTIPNQAKKNVIFEEKDGRKVVHLNGEGKEGAPERSGFYLPHGALMGHHNLTISTDVRIEPRLDQDRKHMRLFDFADTADKRDLGFYTQTYDLNRMRIGAVTDTDRFNGEQDPKNWNYDPNLSTPNSIWLNITTVFTPTTTEVYFNGDSVLKGDHAPFSPSLFYDYDNCEFAVGRPATGGSRALNCYVDSFKMFSTALSDSDIQELLGYVHNDNDEKAVDNAIKNFSINQCMREGGGRIYPSSHLADGVLVTVQSQNLDVIDEQGYLLYTNNEQPCELKLTFSRNNESVTKTVKVTVPAIHPGKEVVTNNSFANESYAVGENPFLWDMQTSTFDWMRDLDEGKLLYMYRFTAGLEGQTLDPSKSYGSWIRPQCGGEGQFQGEYIGALARATNYTDYNDVEAIRSKLERLLSGLQICQNAYPTAPYGQDEYGYLNGFTHLCYDEVAKGKDDVHVSDYPGLYMDEHIWVPWYMYHKQLMMCYDIITYANMGNSTRTNAIKQQAKSMLYKAARWAAKEVLGQTKDQKEMTLRMEYGGMSEVMYLTYKLALDDGNIADAKLFLKAARFFEEDYFLEALYAGSNLLSGIHVNTCLPKFNSCGAAYLVTGDTFYLKTAMNAWDMMVNDMTMANGGLSSIGEHFEEPGHASQARFGEETCCSYNMLRVTDYLYRFTGNAKYMHYFEKVWYNHILPSIDMVGSKEATGDWPDSDPHRTWTENQIAGKAYVMSTDFGHHITYSSPDDSFWCCVATGTESYCKLTYGNFYLDKDNIMYVNMYNNIKTKVPGKDTTLTIHGLNVGTSEKGTESVAITTTGTTDLKKFRFIRPSWTATDPIIKRNGAVIPYTVENDYMIIDAVLNPGETLTINLPMGLTTVEQRGYRGEGAQKYSYALYYGPYMIVPDLGHNQDGKDVYLHDGNGSDQQGQHPYDGSITQTIEMPDGQGRKKTLDESVTKVLRTPEVIHGKDGHAYFTGLEFSFETKNQGNLIFRPFMDINYERYSFYMFYSQEL